MAPEALHCCDGAFFFTVRTLKIEDSACIPKDHFISFIVLSKVPSSEPLIQPWEHGPSHSKALSHQ